jgi:hypothetical protein
MFTSSMMFSTNRNCYQHTPQTKLLTVIIIKYFDHKQTSTKMSICERGYTSTLIAAWSAWRRCIDISCDFLSPRGRRLRSPVLNVAMLYWQFTNALSWRALVRLPRIWNSNRPHRTDILLSRFHITVTFIWKLTKYLTRYTTLQVIALQCFT